MTVVSVEGATARAATEQEAALKAACYRLQY
jgi:hypothetical protein